MSLFVNLIVITCNIKDHIKDRCIGSVFTL